MIGFPKFAPEIDDRRERGPFPSSFLFVDYGFTGKSAGTNGGGADPRSIRIFSGRNEDRAWK